MPDESPRPRPSRENRLLFITIAVSVAVLLILARYRFPTIERTDVTAPPALERLAARATYDELASIVTQLGRRMSAALVVLRVRRGGPLPGPLLISPPNHTVRFVPALYVRPETAIAHLLPEDRVEGIVGDDDAVPVVLVSDAVRQLALVRVPRGSDGALALWEPATTATSGYVAVAEGTRGGVALRPLFLPRTDQYSDPAWERPLLDVAGAGPLTLGSLVFSLEGQLIGLTVDHADSTLLAPTLTLANAAEQLLTQEILPPGDLGIEIQPLSAALARATGAAHGAVVRTVHPTGPAAGRLRVGDVIETLNADTVYSAERLTIGIARLSPGATAQVGVVRKGERVTVEIDVAPRTERHDPPPDKDTGLVLRAVRRVGCEVVYVAPGSAAALGGLQTGDLITHLDGATAPTVAAITRAFAQAKPRTAVILVVDRAAGSLVVALEKP